MHAVGQGEPHSSSSLQCRPADGSAESDSASAPSVEGMDVDMCNGIRTIDGEGTGEAGGRKGGGVTGGSEDHEALREEYRGAVECLKKCECIIAELVEQLESKEERIGGLEEQIVRMSLELANSKACDQQLESKDERISSLEAKVAQMEAEMVRMSLELASSKAFEDEHRAKKKVASVVDFEGGSNDEDDEDDDNGDRDDECSEGREKNRDRKPPRRAASAPMGMLREWNPDPIPTYPARSYPDAEPDWTVPEAAPTRIEKLLRRAASLDVATRRCSLWSTSTGQSDGSDAADALSLNDLSVGNLGGLSGSSVFDRVAAKGSFLLRRTLSSQRLLQVEEDSGGDVAIDWKGGEESTAKGDDGGNNINSEDNDGRRRPSSQRRPPGSLRSAKDDASLRSSTRRTFLEGQGVVFPRSFEEVLAKGCVSDSLSDSLRDSMRSSLRDSLRGSLRGSFRGSSGVGSLGSASLGSGSLGSGPRGGRGKGMRGSARRPSRGC